MKHIGYIIQLYILKYAYEQISMDKSIWNKKAIIL